MANQQTHSGAAQQAAGILRSLTTGRLCIERPADQAAGGCSSLELERRELLESIVESLRGSCPPGRTEATVALLRHLAGRDSA